jgi:hypothetical protein
MSLIENTSHLSAGVPSTQDCKSGVAVLRPEPDPNILVPIRSLGANYRGQISRHLLSLDTHDRYLRFGFVATDEQIERYVAGLDFERDEFLGITNRRLELIAIAHLAMIPATGKPTCAEFGVSVRKVSRGRERWPRLFEQLNPSFMWIARG